MHSCFTTFSAFQTISFVSQISSSLKFISLLKRSPMYAYQPFPDNLRRAVSTDSSIKRKILVAFDFDHTIVDDNTDTVARGLLPENSLTTAEAIYKSTKSWTLYMREIFVCLHRLNISRSQIICAIQNIRPIKYMDSLLKSLSDEKFEVIVISDSNSVFINEWFKGNKLENIVRKVVTNPSWFDDTDLLHIDFYQNQTFCDLSEQNLCKGFALENYMSDRKIDNVMFDHVIFIGDGSNDYCPTLKLSEKDLVFPRMNYALFKKIKQSEGMVKAQVYPWKDGSEIIEVLKEKFELKVTAVL